MLPFDTTSVSRRWRMFEVVLSLARPTDDEVTFVHTTSRYKNEEESDKFVNPIEITSH